MPIFRKFEKIVEKKPLELPQISFSQSIVLINIHLLAKNKKIHFAVFEKQRVAATIFVPTFFEKYGVSCAP
jgi:hypothetical protein